MSSEHKEYSSGNNTIIMQIITKGHFRKENEVRINWSCAGSVSIDEARHFKNDLAKVIAEAEYQNSILQND